ncbi:hypothetical protein AN958_08630 [Leucoagaricus sp. SymC.cos]|nr:hypothetical protein AN958_08630 [Leucoagaricus sp. SymC.cos]
MTFPSHSSDHTSIENIPIEIDFDYLSQESESSSNTPNTPYYKTPHPSQPAFFGKGKTLMDLFNEDSYASHRDVNSFYPFASHGEWQLASYLLHSDLSNAAIDEFLKLELIQSLSLSFSTAKDLRSRCEILPSGPKWHYQEIKPHAPTANPIFLYYRNPLECLETIIQNPLLKDHLEFGPYQLFESATSTVRVFNEWLSGNEAWKMQDSLPSGATLLGTILSSDKTNITNMTGGRVAHPLLISYIILAPLKDAAKIGALLSDPVGHLIGTIRLIFRIVPLSYHQQTPLTSSFFCYVDHWDIVPQAASTACSTKGSYPDPTTELYLLKRSLHANSRPIGDIILLNQIRAIIDLVPQMGQSAEHQLTKETSLSITNTAWLNKYFDKELFFALTSD